MWMPSHVRQHTRINEQSVSKIHARFLGKCFLVSYRTEVPTKTRGRPKSSAKCGKSGGIDMKRLVDVVAKIQVTQGVEISFANKLEVSLDCFICRRRHRTVVISTSDAQAIGCSKRRTCHEFPARILSTSVESKDGEARGQTCQVATYRIEYEFEPFKDREFGCSTQYGYPTWGRVSFKVLCPNCSQTTNQSLQTNLVRPSTSLCKCGNPLYTELDEMPLFDVIE